MGLVPETPLGRVFRDLTGLAHQRLAAVADEIYLAAMGVVLRLRPRPRRGGDGVKAAGRPRSRSYPLPVWRGPLRDVDLGRSVGFFPLVGLVLGLGAHAARPRRWPAHGAVAVGRAAARRCWPR